MEWQPIETAPKDRRYVLLWNGGEVGIGSFQAWERDANGRVIGLEHTSLEDAWIRAGEGFYVEPPPTHWMPLPAPPAESGK